MLPLKSIIVTIAVAWLSACASTGPAPPFNDSFETNISADGTKFFTYIRHLHKGTSGDSHPRDDKKADSALRKAVQAKLETSGYCRDDYLTLEDYEANGIARIRGECRDGASDDDRTQFPNHP